MRIIKQCLKKVAGIAVLNFDELTTFLIQIEQHLNIRLLIYFSDNRSIEGTTQSHLLYGRNIAPKNFMYFDTGYSQQENTLLNKYKRLKVILTIESDTKLFQKNVL